MGIIAALKKRFKYLYLKDVLDFYELDEEVKLQKKMQGQRYDAVLLELHVEIQLTCSMLQVMSKRLGNPCHQALSKMHLSRRK